MTDTDASNDESIQMRSAAKTMARLMHRIEFKAANADATNEQINVAWREVQKERSKLVLRGLGALTKEGYVITPPPGDAAS